MTEEVSRRDDSVVPSYDIGADIISSFRGFGQTGAASMRRQAVALVTA